MAGRIQFIKGLHADLRECTTKEHTKHRNIFPIPLE